MAKSVHSSNYRALLVMVRAIREKAGLSQAELATRLGRPQTWVSKTELGERRLDLEELRQLCEALGVPLPVAVERWLDELE